MALDRFSPDPRRQRAQQLERTQGFWASMSLSGAWWTGDRQPAGKAPWWVSACVPQVSDGTLSCRSLLNPSRQHLALPGSVDGSAILSRPARAEAPDVLMPLPPALAETSPHLRMSLRGSSAPRGLLRKKRMERNSLVMAWRGIFSLCHGWVV